VVEGEGSLLEAWAAWLFDPSGLTPHGFCLLWEPGLIWTHALSDLATAAAYYSIPAALIIVARRRKDLVFRPVFWMFAAFITLCGTDHVMEVITLWWPIYGLQGVTKALMAVVSLLTAVLLWRLLPQALALPSRAQLREATEALRKSEAWHRASFERSPVPVHTLDGEGVITGVSESWLALMGYRAEEVIGQPIGNFSRGGWLPADLARLRLEGEVRDVERTFVTKGGAELNTLMSARVERPGDPNWILCVVIDITARRQAEQALKASEERLRQSQKMEAVGQLTGGIAHDLNNMLQGIGGGLDMMRRRIREGRAEEASRYVAIAEQSVERASALTHRMLAFARRQTLQPKAVDPASLLRGMEELIRRTVGPAIRLELLLEDADWHAYCDENQLENALLNLAINARDAMPDGGTVSFTLAHRLEDDPPDVPDLPQGDYVKITVTDTGTGMTPDVLAHAFEPFFTTKPIGKGTGLGLSQIYGFVRQSGGGIRLESAPGEGTSARIYLPRYTGPVSVVEQPDRGHRVGQLSGTLLLVEDEADVRRVLRERLADLGCNVLEAEDGPSGLRILQSVSRLDALVTDIGLPGLNGRQLADAARQRHPNLPILLITGYAGSALDDMELGAGMDLLSKPFSLDALAERVRKMLETTLVRA
jgi:PAS domain S-box-containing protein